MAAGTQHMCGISLASSHHSVNNMGEKRQILGAKQGWDPKDSPVWTL